MHALRLTSNEHALGSLRAFRGGNYSPDEIYGQSQPCDPSGVAAGYRVFAAETNPFGVAVMAAMKT